MARASLRQEIHRLQEALRPVGASVVDVQRSSLTLKPVLSSVDVERLKAGGLAAAGQYTETAEKLLPELDGIDPALDEWLVAQRHQLNKFIIAQYEAALLEARDFESIERASIDLIGVDALNELAWSARIEAALRQGNAAHARSLAIQFKRFLSENSADVKIEQKTQNLLERVLLHEGGSSLSSAHGGSGSGAAVQGGGGVSSNIPGSNSSDWSVSEGGNNASVYLRRDPMLTALPQMQGLPEVTRRISVHILEPAFLNKGAWDHYPAGDDFHECLEMFFLKAGLFQIVPLHGSTENDGAAFLEACKKADIDYVVRSVLRTSFRGQTPKVVIRLLDVRAGGGVCWGGFAEIPELSDKSIECVLGDLFSDVHWSIISAELDRVSARKDEELSTIGKSLRGLRSALNSSSRSFSHSLSLIGHEAGDAYTAIAMTLTALMRLHSDFSVPASEIARWGIEGARKAMGFQSEYPKMALLWVMLNMADSDVGLLPVSHQGRLKAVLPAGDAHLPQRERSLYALLSALLKGDISQSAAMARQLFEAMQGSPMRAFYEMFFTMTVVVGSEKDQALEHANKMISLYPRHPMSAVAFLLAAVRAELGSVEVEHAAKHVRRLLPDLSVTEVIARCVYLPKSGLDIVRKSLLEADFH
ncbi:hypothetical protein AA106555_1342 [Neokomagataea thailandica NBRC 106555]|nr:hypothetical protein AA106555_1342 [Neokomagataea thailandica NBRC 106555]